MRRRLTAGDSHWQRRYPVRNGGATYQAVSSASLSLLAKTGTG